LARPSSNWTRGDQARQVVAAGDEYHGGGRAGQQRTHLGGVPGVVEQQQHPPAGELAAVQRGLRVRVGRDPRRRYAQRVEEAPHHRWGFQRAGRIEPA
jgi:hypothetical protein